MCLLLLYFLFFCYFVVDVGKTLWLISCLASDLCNTLVFIIDWVCTDVVVDVMINWRLVC